MPAPGRQAPPSGRRLRAPLQITPGRFRISCTSSMAGGRVVSVAACEHHSLVLTEAGAVFSFGEGEGSLGHGDMEEQRTPKVIEALSGERVVAVAAGSQHSLVLTDALSQNKGPRQCLRLHVSIGTNSVDGHKRNLSRLSVQIDIR